jgi:hypothetical protein
MSYEEIVVPVDARLVSAPGVLAFAWALRALGR